MCSKHALSHFSASRGLQQRIFSHTKTNTELEEAISELYYFIQKEGKSSPGFKFLCTELERFEIGKEIRVKLIDGSSFQAWITKTDGVECPLADLGFGITQFLPILIKTALRIKKEKLIAIEEPGTNLHPKLQSKLAGFFLVATEQKISFLLETHSEYLIRKLQSIVVKQPEKSEKVKILYLDDGKISDSITIDTNGELSSKFPSGFYDESERLMLEKEINKAIIKRCDVPLLITEGKTDWKHLTVALEKFNKELDFIDLVEFWKFEDGPRMSASTLGALCKAYAKRHNENRKIIALFDNDKEGRKHCGEYSKGLNFKVWGNDVFSFYIPIPKHFYSISKSACIEMYYTPEELRCTDSKNRRLYLSNEFDAKSGQFINRTKESDPL